MKKLTMLFVFILFIFSVKAQIIVTGIMYDGAGYDAHTDGYVEGTHTHKGGYEYVQLMATRNIDFAAEKYSVVFSRNNNGTTAATLENGWAAASNRTVKVNLTSGTVVKGELFYVGGAEKVIGGYRASGVNLMLSTDMSSSKWYPLAYAVNANQDGTKGPNTIDANINIGDSFDETGTPYYGKANNGLLHNAAAEPSGIAVFAGTNVTKDTYPIDAIFYCGTGTSGTTTIDGTTGISYVYNSTSIWGYKMPNNDWYSSSLLFGQGTNTTAMVRYTTTDQSYFLKLGGDYNTQTGKWDIKRSATYVQVADKSKTTLAGFQIGNAAMIESATGVTTLDLVALPINLTSFTAHKENGTIKLNWATASETNNGYFEIQRSTDGKSFNAISTIKGAGTSVQNTIYTFVDENPAAGINYYRLKQIDFDGKNALSGVVQAKADVKTATLTIWYADQLKANIYTPYGGNATLSIIDINGRKLKTSIQTLNAGNNTITLPYSFAKGVYISVLQLGGQQLTNKFVVNSK